MTTTPSPTPSSPPPDTGGRLSTPWLVTIVVVLLLAVPAAAAVLIENFFRADVEVAESCFTRTAGADVAATDLLDFDATTTVSDAATGVSLLQVTTSVTAHAGDRLLYSEAMVFTNGCGTPVSLTLVSADDPAGGAAVDTAAVFESAINVRFYLSDADGSAVVGLPGTWTESLSVIDGVASAGDSIRLDAGASSDLALVVDAGAATPAGTTGTLRWVATVDAG